MHTLVLPPRPLHMPLSCASRVLRPSLVSLAPTYPYCMPHLDGLGPPIRKAGRYVNRPAKPCATARDGRDTASLEGRVLVATESRAGSRTQERRREHVPVTFLETVSIAVGEKFVFPPLPKAEVALQCRQGLGSVPPPTSLDPHPTFHQGKRGERVKKGLILHRASQ